MAVKNPPQKAQPEPKSLSNKEPELDSQQAPDLITAPVFLHTSSLISPP